MEMGYQLRVARVVTTPLTISLLLSDQIVQIREAGIDLTLISGDEQELGRLSRELGVKAKSIPMVRQPSPYRDLKSLFSLYRYLRREQFDIVHSSTPKAGLLSAVAGKAASTPIRLHTFTGQRWATLSGFSRQLLKFFDRLIATLSTQTYADSESQKEFLIEAGIVPPEKICVLGSGSISGVNIARFSQETWGETHRRQTRRQLGIAEDALIIAFVGRVTGDKGIIELVDAFSNISKLNSSVYLLIVGPRETELDPIPVRTSQSIEQNSQIIATGFTSTPEQYLAVADIFCLPSYREGFGTVVVEAAAMGLPAVATQITGLTDAIIAGKTGLLVPAKDPEALSEALLQLIEQPALRQQLGAAAKARVEEEFQDSYVNNLVIEEYFRLANSLPDHKRELA